MISCLLCKWYIPILPNSYNITNEFNTRENDSLMQDWCEIFDGARNCYKSIQTQLLPALYIRKLQRCVVFSPALDLWQNVVREMHM